MANEDKWDCCALCSMRSCDCGPNDPCRQKNLPRQEVITFQEYGSFVRVEALDILESE